MSNPLVKKIAIGTVQFGLDYGISNVSGKTKENDIASIFNYAVKHGIDTIDTAQAYGSSEETISKYHQDKFKIVTKLNCNLFPNFSVEQLINESLKKLRVDRLYSVLYHSFNPLDHYENIHEELLKMKKIGVIKKIGLSAYEQIEIERYIEKFGKPDIIQIPYNFLDKRLENLMIDLHTKGVEIHSRSVFLQGLLLINPNELGDHFGEIKPLLNELQNQFINKDSLAGFLLSFVLQKSFIDKVIIGVNNFHQFFSNVNNIYSEQKQLNNYHLKEMSASILNPNMWPKN